MWQSKTKTDLIIEVWEKLDCESVGEREILAIETAVEAQFGASAIDSPMTIARMLADEGAELRHSEIMKLHVNRFSDQPHEAAFRNLIDVSNFGRALSTINRIENLRRKFASDNDREGLRQLRTLVIDAKASLIEDSNKRSKSSTLKSIDREIAEWLTIWLQSPEIFEQWIAIRRRSTEFQTRFKHANSENEESPVF